MSTPKKATVEAVVLIGFDTDKSRHEPGDAVTLAAKDFEYLAQRGAVIAADDSEAEPETSQSDGGAATTEPKE